MGNKIALGLPGKLTATAWELPKNLSFDEWKQCGRLLTKVEGALQWWIGDWWVYGEHKYGERKEIADAKTFGPLAFGTLMTYGSVARAYETSIRIEVLSFAHHQIAMAAEPDKRRWWLEQAEKNEWSASALRSQISQQGAIGRTMAIEFQAAELGRFAVIYADPPWRYENPPMGGSNRSIERHYPTMTVEEICALPIRDAAAEDCTLFLWATNPKLAECFAVLDAWGFTYRTNLVWVKDKIGMGYHARERHELILVAKRGALPPPPVEARFDSVIEAPRLEHSAKPPVVRDMIDQMYPNIRKLELFARLPEARELWTFWGNQLAEAVKEAAE